MIDLQKMHHVGIPVADIAVAQSEMSAAFGLSWAPVRTFDPLPFWTPEGGRHEVLVHATYSRGGGQRLELVQGTGPFYDPASAPDARHIGVWSENLTGEASRLRALGWQIVACGAPPEEGYGSIAYLAPPGGGVLVELISTELTLALAEWIGD